MKKELYDLDCLYRQFCKFLRKNSLFFWEKRREPKRTEESLFWITPWFETPLPWYNIVMAMIYHSYTGNPIKLIINDMLYDSKIVTSNKKLEPLIEKTIMRLRSFRYIKIMKLSELPSIKLDKQELEILEDTARLSTIKMLRASIGGKGYDKMCSQWNQELLPVAEKINSFVRYAQGKEVIFLGGSFLETGYLLKKCRMSQVNIVTFDAAVGRLLLGYNCVSAQYGNTKEIYDVVNKSAGRKKILQDAWEVLHNRMDAKKEMGIVERGEIFQTKAYGDKTVNRHDVVIFSNIENDAAALGTHIFYKNDREWLSNTVEYIIANTNYSVAVREHPANRRCRDRIVLKYLQKQYGDNPRFHYYGCSDRVNSYDLLKNAKVVLVNTSSVGVESAMLGKCVVTESDSYYSQSGFVKKCHTEKEYFETIHSLLDNPQEIPMSARESAALYYGLIQLCGGALTKFTPQNVDYFEWTEMSLKELIESDDTKMVFKALINKEPLTLVKYKKLYK